MDFNKKNDIKQDTFLKMQSSEHLKIWWTLFRRCLLIIIWKGKKISLVVMKFLMTVENSHHINAWKNYLKLKWALRFFYWNYKEIIIIFSKCEKKNLFTQRVTNIISTLSWKLFRQNYFLDRKNICRQKS